MSSSSDSEIDSIPDDIKEEASTAMEIVLPEISKERYLKAYDEFMKWRANKNVKSLSEPVFITYFSELSKKLKPSSLWSTYSMLKATVNSKHDVNMKNYTRLNSFLKRTSNGFKSKKSKVFTAQEVETFLNQAPDIVYLAMKVVMIFGISGACRSTELTNMTVDSIEKHGKLLLVRLPKNNKNQIERSFVIKEDFARVVEKYQGLRPANIETKRFFLKYQRGKCMTQVIGKNKIAGMPKQIAEYLELPDTDMYTGHCFRRSSASLLANSCADLKSLKRHAGWKSNTSAKVFIEESMENKAKISDKITETINISPGLGSVTSESSGSQVSTSEPPAVDPLPDSTPQPAPATIKVEQTSSADQVIIRVTDKLDSKTNVLNRFSVRDGHFENNVIVKEEQDDALQDLEESSENMETDGERQEFSREENMFPAAEAILGDSSNAGEERDKLFRELNKTLSRFVAEYSERTQLMRDRLELDRARLQFDMQVFQAKQKKEEKS